mgnify:CR=1 FL=1
MRAILTRRAQKLRDFYDLFILYKHGFRAEDLKKEIIDKIRKALYYKKYRNALERNKEAFKINREILEDLFERSLFVTKPTKEFEDFLEESSKVLREIVAHV